jgi:hypothetical protein
MCGACDCPSCGPAQGYRVVRVWDHKSGRFVHRNPDDDDDEDDEEFEPACEPDFEPDDDREFWRTGA